jgi:hypothetical protein
METERRRKVILHRVIERLNTRINRLIWIRDRLQRRADSMEGAHADATARKVD